MQLKTILTSLAAAAAIVLVTAAPAVDANVVPPGTRLNKIINLNDGDFDDGDLNDAASKIIFVPGGGYPRPPYYPGGRDPTIIIIGPYGPYGSTLARRPGKRSDDENEDSKILVIPKPFYPPGGHPRIDLPFPSQGLPSGFPSGRPFPKRHDEDKSSKKKEDKVEAKSSKKKKTKGMNEADVDHEDLDWEDDENEDAKYIYPPSTFWDTPHPKHIMY
ncbi:hypothetical protein BGZ96_000550 [Linnemannia gamsii]|uniref:Uncharacterized protein n=1 Tax=Linnemannia gamsii TaxID=64522 RepID=A0ABQ7JPE9_9FUNG|nr:hypothetical protein BGZ96_000550 [Linnemannia gamsii]